MGLFDRLRGKDSDEEVELRPQSRPDFERTRRRVNNPDRSGRREPDARERQDEEVDLEEMWEDNRQQNHRDTRRDTRKTGDNSSSRADTDDADDDEFILPGMKSVADEDEADAADEPGAIDPSDERLDELLEQNERIISLLEEIADMAGGEESAESGSSASDTGMW